MEIPGPDWLRVPDWMAWSLGVLLTLGAIIEAARRVGRPLVRLYRKFDRIANVWHGEPAHDGHPARPGLVDRVISIETELRPNSGASMKDQVGRIESKIDTAAARAEEAKQAASAAAELVADLDERVTPWIESGEQQLETYRSSLVDIGLDQEIPKRDPNRRDRRDDT